MSKLIKKLGKVLNTKQSASAGDPLHLEVDAVPTRRRNQERATIEEVPENIEIVAVSPSSEPSPLSGGLRDQSGVAGPGMNQANQFNSPSQTIFQFNNANGIHIGNNFTINQTLSQEEDTEKEEGVNNEAEKSPTSTQSASLRKKYPKTRTIDLLLKSDTDIDHPDIDVIATHLGEDWRSVARDLGFSNGEIDHFHEDNFAYGVKEVIYKFLTEWRQREEEPTVGKVCQVLWKREIHREVVYKLKLDYKRRKSEN